ncbi:MAG: hypothetical protein IJJ26_08995 [Victivallales bacterium]|nr:hypothetical protein [Victivallales bacterium]
MTFQKPTWFVQVQIPTRYLPVYFGLLCYFGYALYQYCVNGGQYSSLFWFLHGPFHEVGHALASFLPEVIHVLAGSVMQWLLPIACGIYFFLGREKHASFVALAWLGFSLLDSATYMKDAIEQELPLVAPFAGPDAELIHDWNYLFSRWDLLPYAHTIGNITAAIGYAIVIIACNLIVGFAAFTIASRWAEHPEKPGVD